MGKRDGEGRGGEGRGTDEFVSLARRPLELSFSSVSHLFAGAATIQTLQHTLSRHSWCCFLRAFPVPREV